MTQTRKRILICSTCGEENEVNLYDSVNVDNDKMLNDRVLKREINSVLCKKCGAKSELIKDFLYTDNVINNIWVYVFPERSRSQSDKIVGTVDKCRKNLKRMFGVNRSRVYSAFGYDELLKIIKHPPEEIISKNNFWKNIFARNK